MSTSVQVLGYHETPGRVRFGEVDRYGYLWHGHALAYFEAARADLARRTRLSVSELLEFNLAVPMVDLWIEYKKPAHEDEELVTQISLLRQPLRTPFIQFAYRIVKLQDGQEVLRGRTRQLVMPQNGTLRTRLPDEIQSRLESVWSYLETCPRWQEEQILGLMGGPPRS
ncbi:Thioesterase superfamily [Cystobacter fuscus DSM 2262]|uniref:Thioesterase superfamily n=1 Tax=Cystobacter fuscus (strain ATCC 25194 / DSM 2262 / NBRC 100088 / M29) TaxID=1242864 RepID=S9QP43_CYSF2|nr:acyl-CoA thioesterase [Cystobacter fuscus]EPX63069.1 Thioesterase superfamily [Cystobacter fuscus DSM 2262]